VGEAVFAEATKGQCRKQLAASQGGIEGRKQSCILNLASAQPTTE